MENINKKSTPPLVLKKAFAVLMAVVMVLSAWVFTAPLKAEAVDSGTTYDVRITWKLVKYNTSFSSRSYYGSDYSGWDKRGNKQTGISLFFKDTFGTNAYENEVYWNIGKGTGGGVIKNANAPKGTATSISSTSDVKNGNNGSTYYSTATISGFPTKVYGFNDNDNATANCCWEVTKIEVKATGTSTYQPIWSGTAHVDSIMNQYYFKIENGSGSGNDSKDGYATSDTANWIYPKATTVVFDKKSSDLTVPKTGTNTSTNELQTHVVDRYGMVLGSTYYTTDPTVTFDYANNNGLSATKKATTTGYDPWTISVDNAARISGATTAAKDVKVTVKYSVKLGSTTTTAEGSYTFKLTDVNYTFTLDGNGGTVTAPSNGSSITVIKDYGNTFGSTPNASRTGFTFEGFYPSRFTDSYETQNWSGTKLASGTTFTSDQTWYAAWQAKQSTVTYSSYRVAGQAEPLTKSVTGYYSRTITPPADIPTAIGSQIVNGDYTYTFKGWKTSTGTSTTLPTTFPADNTTYVADYDTTEAYADMTELKTQIELAKERQRTDAQIFAENGYTDASREAFERALNAAELRYASKETLPDGGASQQQIIDNLAKDLENARKKLELKKYVVVFVAEDGTVLKDGYSLVEHGKSVTVPETPVKAPDDYNHYEFLNWDTDTSVCDYVTDDLIIKAVFDTKGHSFDYKDAAPSSCTTNGTRIRYCADEKCDWEEPPTVNPEDKAGHAWERETIVDATCIEDGYSANRCQVCRAIDEDTIEDIKAVGHHTWDEENPEEVIPQSCTEKGANRMTCSVCDAEEVITTSALGHEYSITEELKETCTEAGYTRKVCERCGDITEEVIIPSLGGHKFVAVPEESVLPTCVNDGYIVYRCSVCDLYEKTDIDPKTDVHTYDEPDWDESKWYELAPATCTQEGVKARDCEVCGNTDIGSIPTIPHTFDENYTVDEFPTCTAPGSQSHHCTVCGLSNPDEEADIIAPLGHDYDTSYDAPTCTSKGTYSGECSRCHDKFSTPLDETAHNYQPKDDGKGGKVDATCWHSSYVVYECTECGDSYNKYTGEENELPAHDWNVSFDDTTHGTTIVSGTCKVTGCTAAFSEEVKSKHALTEWEVTTPPTCKDDGVVTVSCAAEDCTEDYEITIPKNPDAHVLTTTVNKANCTKEGSVTNYCSVCEQTVGEDKVLDALGHLYSVDVTAATCTTPGTKTYTCYRNGCDKGDNYTYTEEIAVNPDAHKFVKGESYEATCLEPAYTEYTCEYCEKVTYKDYTGKANGHDFEVTVTQTGAVITVEVECKTPNCGATLPTITKTVDDPHNYNVVADVTPSTCQVGGSVTLACNKAHDPNCNESITVDLPVDTDAHTPKTVEEPHNCDTAGYIDVVCEDCGEQLCDRITVSDTGHKYVLDTENSLAPNCRSVGYRAYKCDVCGDTSKFEILEIVPDAHKWSATETVEPSCVDDGYDVKHCEVCGTEERSNPTTSLGHTKGEVKTIPSTCTVQGKETTYCDTCGEVIEEKVLDLAAHQFKETVFEATCTQPGHTDKVCSECDLKTTTLDPDKPALGHNWNPEYELIENPSCKENGVMARRCLNPGCEELIDVKQSPKVDHVMGDWVVDLEPNCSREGSQHRDCVNCDYFEEKPLMKTDHNWSSVYTTDWAADCSKAGQKSIHCINCDTIREGSQVVIEKLPHTLTGEWKKVSDPTCTEAGREEMECSECHEFITQSIPATGHQFNTNTPIGSYTAVDGSYTWDAYPCTKCNAKCVNPTILAYDENGNPIQGANVTLRNLNGTVLASGQTDEYGRFKSNAYITDGDFVVNVKDTKNYYEGAGRLTVKDGYITGAFTSGNSGRLAKTDCGNCSCHGTGFFSKLKRWFYTFFSVIFGRNFKCCDDMQWQGSWASRLS